MNEEFLYYIWRHHVRLQVKYKTIEGICFIILDKGMINTDAGADIANVRIRIGEVEWGGSVELHVKSSDWNRHRHSEDASYNNVLLHFVGENDAEIYTQDSRKVPAFIFPNLEEYYTIFQRTFSKKQFIYCDKHFVKVSSFIKNMWLQRLVVERIEGKTQMVFRLLAQNKNNWEETTYQLLARYLGQKLNGDAFEQLARKLPQRILAKHKNSLFQIEALLFGQAGMLEDNLEDVYCKQLKQEYVFLRGKYDLCPIEPNQWKYLRLRPANFPSLRIAQLAMLIHLSSGMFSRLLEISTVGELRKLFDYGTSEYWKEHYVFGKESTKKSTHKIGKSLQDILIINSVVPILFAYSRFVDDDKWQNKALLLLEEIDIEQNYIVQGFTSLGLDAKNAYDSQAMLQLKSSYCELKKCEQCAIGHEILKDYYT